MPARPLGEPVADQLGLVRGVVVHDEMDIEVGWDVGLDLVEELAELNGTMTREAFPDHLAGGDVEGCEQRCDAVALVVMTATGHLARSHGQQGLAAVERLDLRFLIDAQHDRVLGRSHVETDDVADLGDEVGIG